MDVHMRVHSACSSPTCLVDDYGHQHNILHIPHRELSPGTRRWWQRYSEEDKMSYWRHIKTMHLGKSMHLPLCGCTSRLCKQAARHSDKVIFPALAYPSETRSTTPSPRFFPGVTTEELAIVEMCPRIRFHRHVQIQMGEICPAILLHRPLPAFPGVPILNLHVDQSETHTNLIKDMTKYAR